MRARTSLLIAVALLAIPAHAAAHANAPVASTDTAGAVRITFSAPVEQRFLSVRHPSGGQVPARVDPDDDHTVVISTAGSDPLRWQVLSRDGHVSRGTVSPDGALGAVDAVRSSLSVVADALMFMAFLGLIGLIAVRFWVVAPAWRAGGCRPPGASPADEWRAGAVYGVRAALGRWWTIWWALVGGAALALVLAPAGLLIELDSGDLGSLVAVRWGHAWIATALALSVAASAMAWLNRTPRRVDPAASQGQPGLAAGALMFGAFALAWSGHAGSGTDAAVSIGLHALHVIATGAWLGGLAALLVVVPSTRHGRAPAEAIRLDAAVVVRFSALAISCVGVLVVTGVYRAIGELTAVDDLIDTGYGRALLIKLIMFSVLLVGGVLNRLVLHPRMERTALGLRDSDGGAQRALRVSVAAELVLATFLLVVVAVMVNLPPP